MQIISLSSSFILHISNRTFSSLNITRIAYVLYVHAQPLSLILFTLSGKDRGKEIPLHASGEISLSLLYRG